MIVNNITSNHGNKIANQFRITDDNGNYFFQSYQSIIVKIDNNNQVFLDKKYWNYSVTTAKYRNIFLHEDTKTIKNKIKSGKYILTDLNK